MGRKIDRFVLETLFAALVLFLCLNAFGSIFLSAAMTALILAALNRLTRRNRRKTRLSRSDAVRVLNGWAFSKDEDAIEKISALLTGSKYDCEPIYIIRPYEFALSKAEVFAKWKANAGKNQISIISACKAEPAVRNYAETLHSPCVRLMDGDRLLKLILHSGIEPPAGPSPAERLRGFFSIFRTAFNRTSWKRCSLTGLIMTLMYILRGNSYYLLLAVGSCSLAGISICLRQK